MSTVDTNVFAVRLSTPAGGFARGFLPNVPNQLAQGGTLEMLGVDGAPGYDTRTGQTPEWLPATWVEIPVPDPANPAANSVFS